MKAGIIDSKDVSLAVKDGVLFMEPSKKHLIEGVLSKILGEGFSF